MDLTSTVQAVAGVLGTDKPQNRAAAYLKQVLTWGLRVLIFLVPVMFLPVTFEAFEFPKQLILLGLGVVLLVVWVSYGVVAREAKLVKSWLNWAVFALLVITIIATVTSVDPITSIIGFYGRYSGSLLAVVAYTILYYLVSQNVRSSAEGNWLLGSWITGVGLSTLVLVLQLFGVRFLPFYLGQQASFSPLGSSLNAIAIVLAASLPIGLYLARQAKLMAGRILALLFSILALVTIFLVNYSLGWIALLVASAAWLGLVFWKNEHTGSLWTVVPALGVLVSIVSLVYNISPLSLPVPVEVNLSLGASWKVALENAKTSPIVGTGPETFVYGFSKYKPENFNDSNFWAYRFDRATSEFAQLLSTTGYVGVAIFALAMLLALFLLVRSLMNRNRDDWYRIGTVGVAALVLIVMNVLYFNNTVMAVFMWLVLGLLASFTSPGERAYSLNTNPRVSMSFSFGLALAVLLAVGVWVIEARFLMADIAYAQAQVAAQKAETLEQAQVYLVRAVNLNPWRDVYRVGLAQVWLALANREAAQPAGETKEEQQAQVQRLQSYIASSIAAARSATELSQQNVANWETLGSIYRGTVLFTRDAEPWVIASFEQAISLEPSNPALYTELGRAYLIAADRKRQEAAATKVEADKARLESEASEQVAKAYAQFEKAVALKPDYGPARFSEVLALEQQGKLPEAIKKLEALQQLAPQDLDVLYELGSLYFTTSDYTKAEQAFLAITTLVPNHANAHFGLSLVYQKQNQLDKAIVEMEKVKELNPDNKDVQAALDALKAQASGTTAVPKK